MLNKEIFREYDIRGIVGKDLTSESVGILARAIGTYFVRKNVKKVSLAYDARESSPLFRDLIVKGFNECGINVLDVGMVPTPLLYFTLFTEEVDGGVMITGSHNPAEYNGFKISVGKDSIFGEEIQELNQIAIEGIFANGSGSYAAKDVIEEYLKFVFGNIKLGPRKLKVVIDAGNGIGGIIGAPLYKRLGFETVDLFIEPDSRFPNHHPDPTVVENLQHAVNAVLANGADLAIVFDGDGDRIGVIDEKGGIIWGDDLTLIFARAILEDHPKAVIVSEVKCSQRLFDDIEKHGGSAIMWKAGHSIIKSKMKETGAKLAGEMSGHIFFADRFFGFDDAIYSGARLLEILSHSKLNLSEFLVDLPAIVNTPEIRIECRSEAQKFQIVQRVTDHFKLTNQVNETDGARISFETGWGLVRASNTQAILVLRFEARDDDSLKKIRDIVESKVNELLMAI